MEYKYRFEIELLSPVHIGTGEVYEPTNFVIEGGYLYEFDETLFLKALPAVEKEGFHRVVAGGDYFQIIRFYKQHVEHAKKIAYSKTAVSKKIESKYNTTINKDGSQNRNQLEIQRTYKNPNTHKAVIPGSSIKGMLDTVFGIFPPKVKDNEPRQKLKVSDALMFDGKTEIAFSYRKHKDPNKSAKSQIPLMIEAIAEKSKFVVTVETPLEFEEIIKKFQQYFNQSQRKNSYFQTTPTGFVARIGKFSGKPYMVYDGENVKNSYGKSVATHTVYEDGSLFGWVDFRLIENDEYLERLESIRINDQNYFEELLQRQKEILEKIEKEKKEAREAKRRKEEQKAKEEAERKAKEEAEAARLASLSPVDKLIETIEITELIRQMQNKEIENYEEIKMELARKIKAKLQENPKTWDKAKQKALKRKEFIQQILGE